MSDGVDVQYAVETDGVPTVEDIRRWATAALLPANAQAELTVRIVDANEGATLNRDYRGKDGATNVLAFPAGLPADAGVELLGDVVICAPVVAAQAAARGKTAAAHWAHLVVHGILHLQGFNHLEETQAARMETQEVDILGRLGYSNPYETGDPVADEGSNPPQ